MSDSDVAPELFKVKLQNSWSSIRDAFLDALSPDDERELTENALTMPTSGLTHAVLADVKQRYGEEKAYHYGAEYWTKAMFDFYCDRIIKELPWD